MNGKYKIRVLGRVLAVEEIMAVAGARQTSSTSDTKIDIYGNGDSSNTQETNPAIDCTNPFADF